MVRTRMLWFLAACSLIGMGLAGDAQAADRHPERLRVAVSTTLMESIVRAVGGQAVEVTSLIPADMCPGHFDLKPSDLQQVREAALFLSHGFEGETLMSKVLELTESTGGRRVTVNIPGNWMVPDIHLQAVKQIANILTEARPEQADYFLTNAVRYTEQIRDTAGQLRTRAGQLQLAAMPVVCSQMQESFVSWLGPKVIATYLRAEDITAGQLKEIIDRARTGKARLVVDNLQSGAETGLPIARELGIPHLVLNNFPGPGQGGLSYIAKLRENAGQVFEQAERNYKP